MEWTQTRVVGNLEKYIYIYISKNIIKNSKTLQETQKQQINWKTK